MVVEDAKNEQEAERVTLPEKIMAPLALIVAMGWLIHWSKEGGFESFSTWSLTLSIISFVCALALVFAIILKLFKRFLLPYKLHHWVLAIGSMVPVVTLFFSELLENFGKAFLILGSLGLAYVSLTNYWRRRIPEPVLDPFGKDDEEEDEAAPMTNDKGPDGEGMTESDEREGEAPSEPSKR